MFSRFALTASVLAITACGGPKDGEEICTKAADRYVACVAKILGDEAKEMADGKRDIAACAADKATVEMYRTCLPKADDCDAFMNCVEEYAASH